MKVNAELSKNPMLMLNKGLKLSYSSTAHKYNAERLGGI